VRQSWWGIFFGVVLGATFLLWIVAPFFGWWLPANVASFGGDVDFLFYVILAITGFFFVLTEALLVYAMCRYAGRDGVKATYTHGNHRLELAWTAVPAGVLLFVAFAQVRAWERIKYQSRMPEPDLTLQVSARQWDWRVRYPADTGRFASKGDAGRRERLARSWAEYPEIDDVVTPAELHVWKGAKVKFYLKTSDVLHSFYLPNLRLKQDALPGKTIPVWFEATDANAVYNEQTRRWEQEKGKVWEIACAELCGGRHYAMRGKFYVHKDKKDYEEWLKKAKEDQQRRSPEEDPEKGATARR
jgi:cytochrome c oxidase subunit II